MATNRNTYDLQTLSKTSIDNNDFLEIVNSSTRQSKKILATSLFPAFSTTGTGGQDVFINITNKNQLNFKGIISGDTGLLTVATTDNNIVLTTLEAGIDLSLCNNTTSGFSSGVDFTETIVGENSVVHGGTGLATIAKGALLYASAADQISATAAMSTNGQLLIGNATNGFPSVATLTAGANVTITNGAGAITLAASLANAEANIDLRNAADDTTYNVDLSGGFVSGDGSAEGITVDSAGKVYMGQSTPTAFFSESLNIKGGIRFADDTAPTIKPTATSGSTAGAAVTIESAGSVNGNAGNLNINGGVASGSGAGGSLIATAGKSASGTDGDIQLKTYTGSTATAGLTVGAEGQDVTVNTGNLIIKDAAKGIIHTGSGTVTQATNHSTATAAINSTSGVITLAAVALAAGAEADFAVPNSTIQADSIILLTVQSPAAASATDNATLVAQLDEVNAGSMNIRLSNPGAGATAASASKIHFLVINNS